TVFRLRRLDDLPVLDLACPFLGMAGGGKEYRATVSGGLLAEVDHDPIASLIFGQCGDFLANSRASSFMSIPYFFSNACSPIWCCSWWCARQSGMVHQSDGFCPMPPSVPRRTWAHSVAPSHPPPAPTVTEHSKPLIHARWAGKRRRILGAFIVGLRRGR